MDSGRLGAAPGSAAAARAPRAQLTLAALLVVAGVSAFAATDALSKLVIDDFNVVQIIWARYAFFVLPLALIIAPWRWPRLLRTDAAALQIGRGFLPIVGSMAIVVAFRWVSLADVTAITFAGPLIVVMLALPMLGERATAHRWIAVACGFVGVIIIVRPGTAAFHPALLLPVGVAFVLALYQITTRMVGRADPRTTVLYTALVGTVVTSVLVPFVWRAPGAMDWLILVASGILHGLGHFLMIRGLAMAEASAMAPFSYAQIVAATLLGMVLFGEFPDAATLIGIVVIVGSGLSVYFAERAR